MDWAADCVDCFVEVRVVRDFVVREYFEADHVFVETYVYQ